MLYRPRLIGSAFPFAVLLLAVLAVFAVACGSSGDGSSEGSSGSTSSGSGPTSPSPTADDGSDDATEEEQAFPSFDEVEPITPDLPPGGQVAVGRTPLRGAADAIRTMIEQAGISVAGLEVHVLPIPGTDESLLVLESSATELADETGLDQDFDATFVDVITSPAAQAANITRVALNYHDADEQGPLVFTMTLPVDAAVRMVEGTLTDAEASEQVLFDFYRPE